MTPRGWRGSLRSGWTRPASSRPPGWRPPGGHWPGRPGGWSSAGGGGRPHQGRRRRLAACSDHDWLAGIGTVALDPWRGYASALVAPLGHARVVVDHFHAIRLANTVVDQVRRRTQQATLGHRGHKPDPLYRIRKLLLTAAEQLTSRGRTRLRAGWPQVT
jgi:Transposase